MPKVKGKRGDNPAEAGVDRTDGHVVVAWFCGGKYEFTPELLREQVAYVDQFARHPQAWLSLKDMAGRRYSVRCDGKTFYAAESVTDTDPERMDRIPWRGFRAALMRQADRKPKKS